VPKAIIADLRVRCDKKLYHTNNKYNGAGNTIEDKNSSADEIANVNFYAVRPEGT